MKRGAHHLNGFLHYTLYGASPSGMNSSHGMMNLIIKKHRNAVGSRNTYAHTPQVGNQRIDSFENHLADRLRF